MTAPFDLVAFGPHPDDVELFCGGLVARTVAQGYRVAIVDLTAGELASRGTPDERAREARVAADILGVAHRACVGLPDGGVRDDDASTAAVVDVLRQLRPRVVLAPWREERHPDHAAASVLVDRAVFMAGLARHPSQLPRHRVSRVLYYLQRVVPQPDFMVDITDAMDTKRAAIAAHVSQVAQREGVPATLVGAPDALDALEARDRAFGACLGVVFAEGYCVGAPIAVDDVVAQFGDRPEPHFVFRGTR